MWFIYFLDLLWVRYKCAKFHHCDSDCELLIEDKHQICSYCKKRPHQIKSENKNRLIPTLKQHRLRNKELENHAEKMRFEIEKSGKAVNGSLEKDLISIYLNVADNEIPPFMKLFWEE